MRSSFQFIIDPCKARAATTGRTFVTASAPFIQGSDTHWELFSTTLSKLFVYDNRCIRRGLFVRLHLSPRNQGQKRDFQLITRLDLFYALTELYNYFVGSV